MPTGHAAPPGFSASQPATATGKPWVSFELSKHFLSQCAQAFPDGAVSQGRKGRRLELFGFEALAQLGEFGFGCFLKLYKFAVFSHTQRFTAFVCKLPTTFCCKVIPNVRECPPCRKKESMGSSGRRK